MKLFPAFFDLASRPCLVVGGGGVGLEKTKSLLAAGATVLVVDPAPTAELLAHAAAESGGHLSIEARAFRAGDCGGRFLVFACTGDGAVDDEVVSAARAAGALCCRTDGAAADFTTGAVLRRGDVCLAVSSGGASPRLAAEARDRAAEAVGLEFGEAARLLGGLRERLRAQGSPRSNVMDGRLVRETLEALRSGDGARAEAFVEEALATCRTSTGIREGSCTR